MLVQIVLFQFDPELEIVLASGITEGIVYSIRRLSIEVTQPQAGARPIRDTEVHSLEAGYLVNLATEILESKGKVRRRRGVWRRPVKRKVYLVDGLWRKQVCVTDRGVLRVACLAANHVINVRRN